MQKTELYRFRYQGEIQELPVRMTDGRVRCPDGKEFFLTEAQLAAVRRDIEQVREKEREARAQQEQQAQRLSNATMNAAPQSAQNPEEINPANKPQEVAPEKKFTVTRITQKPAAVAEPVKEPIVQPAQMPQNPAPPMTGATTQHIVTQQPTIFPNQTDAQTAVDQVKNEPAVVQHTPLAQVPSVKEAEMSAKQGGDFKKETIFAGVQAAIEESQPTSPSIVAVVAPKEPLVQQVVQEPVQQEVPREINREIRFEENEVPIQDYAAFEKNHGEEPTQTEKETPKIKRDEKTPDKKGSRQPKPKEDSRDWMEEEARQATSSMTLVVVVVVLAIVLLLILLIGALFFYGVRSGIITINAVSKVNGLVVETTSRVSQIS